jgi:hypothetical protein
MCNPSNKTEANNKRLINHVSPLQKQISMYFKFINASKFEWLKNPFAASKASGLSEHEQPTHTS